MNNRPPFYVEGINKFTCQVSLVSILSDMRPAPSGGGFITVNSWGIFINGIDLGNLHFVSESASFDEISEEGIIKSAVSFDLPKVSFDSHVSLGEGCGPTDNQYVFNFRTGIVYVVGSDIHGTWGLTG